jgi:hypothetical protein
MNHYNSTKIVTPAPAFRGLSLSLLPALLLPLRG